MHYKIEIDGYVNGIRIEELNCFDRAVAAAAGSFDYNYYFYYSLMSVIELNWTDLSFWVNHNSLAKWLERNNRILGNLGLTVQSHKYSDDNQCIKIINNSLRKKNPVLIFMPYYSIPWDERYLEKSQRRAIHILLITEYNEDNQTYIIRDDYMMSQHNMESLQKLSPGFNQSLLWRFQLPRGSLLKTLKFSNKICKEENMYYADAVISMSQIVDRGKATAEDMRNYLKTFNYRLCISRLNGIIENFNTESELKVKLKETREKYGVFRRNYLGSIQTISKAVNLLLNELYGENAPYSTLDGAITDIYEYRDRLCNKLQKMILKGQFLDGQSKTAMQNQVFALDERLIQFLRNI